MNVLAKISIAAALFSSLAVTQVLAQGPAGAGAAQAAGGGSSSGKSHSLNPMKWIGKKDAKRQPDTAVSGDELDNRLETKLRASQELAPDASLKQVCDKFVQRVDCVAALHASHNLGLNFECVKSNVSGVRTGVDTTACRMPEGDKPLSLEKTIKLLKPDANAKGAAKDAEVRAKEEIKAAGA